MEKTLEQWKRDHEIPYDAELKVEVTSWDLGNWRLLRSPDPLRVRVRWMEKQYDWVKWSGFDFDTWMAWIRNGCRPPYYMYSPMRRREEKKRIMDQLEFYAAAMGIDLNMIKPTPRRSEHEPPLGFDTAGPDGCTFHYEFDGEDYKRERYGNWPEQNPHLKETDEHR